VKIRSYLLIFALGIFVPMIAFAVVTVVALDREKRATVQRGGVETARALLNAVDRELLASITTLKALATARSLERDDLATFHEDARRVLASQRNWHAIILITPSGQLVVDTGFRYGMPLPPLRESDTFHEVLRTGQPLVGPALYGPIIQRFAVPIRVPVFRQGAVVYVLTGVVDTSTFAVLLREQQLPEDWVGTVFDSRDNIVARTRGVEQFEGRPISAEFRHLLATQQEGWGVTHTLEGEPVYTAFRRSSATSWGVGLGIPPSTIEGPLRRSLLTIAGGGLALLLAALVASALVGARIARPVTALAAAAKAFGQRAESRDGAATRGPAEVGDVARAFEDAAADLRAAEEERVALLAATQSARLEAEAGQQAASRLAAIVEGADDVIVGKTLDGIVTSWNPAAERLFGYSAAEAVGRPITIIIPPERHEEERQVLDRIKQGEVVDHFETERITKDGRRLPISLTISPVRDPQGRIIGASKIARDIRERRRADARLLAQYTIARLLVDATSLAEAAGPLLAAVCETLEWEVAELWVADEARGELRCQAIHAGDAVATAPFLEASRAHGFPRGRGLPGRVWETAVPSWIENLSADPNFPRARAALAAGLHTGFAFPIAVGARVVAIIEVFSRERRSADPAMMRVMATIGQQIGLFIERRRAEDALGRERELLRTIIDGIPVMITLDEPGTRRLHLNREFQRVTGWSVGDARARDFVETWAGTEPGVQGAEVSDAGAASWRDVRMTTQEGQVIETAWSSVSLSDGTRIGIGLDITDRKQRELDLERARTTAEAESRAKDEFLAMLGHELRNPLSVVSSALDVLNRTDSAHPSAARARVAVERQVRRLTELVDDLLDVARVTSGKIVLARQPVDLGAIVARAVEAFRPTGRAAGHVIHDDVQSVWVDGDETRLEQIVDNLFGNSAKFTPAGGEIRITVRAEGRSAVLRVEDSGVGIAPDVLPRVFDLFVQGDRSLDRTQGGLGLGLTLVRRLVELHGGEVEAASEGMDRGAVFVVRLPRIEAPQREPRAERPLAAKGAGRRVLIVEDNPDGREMLRTMLELQGHEVHEAEDGREGVEQALALRPDMAIIDIGLPELNGYDVARRLRHELGGQPMRLVALTGYGRPEDLEQAAAAGFDAHLVKPVDPQRLSRILAEA
jgi:PAS domain S-box-containing protein